MDLIRNGCRSQNSGGLTAFRCSTAGELGLIYKSKHAQRMVSSSESSEVPFHLWNVPAADQSQLPRKLQRQLNTGQVETAFFDEILHLP